MGVCHLPPQLRTYEGLWIISSSAWSPSVSISNIKNCPPHRVSSQCSTNELHFCAKRRTGAPIWPGKLATQCCILGWPLIQWIVERIKNHKNGQNIQKCVNIRRTRWDSRPLYYSSQTRIAVRKAHKAKRMNREPQGLNSAMSGHLTPPTEN